jgi:hypothetical protein
MIDAAASGVCGKQRAWPRGVAVATAALLGVTALVGCGGGRVREAARSREAPAAGASFAGTTTDDYAFVGIVRQGDHVIAYVCDGEIVGEWFLGEARGDHPEMMSKSGARFEATITADTVTGTFSPVAGPTLAFTAEISRAPAGLYRAESEAADHVGGWIVLPDGRQRGVVQRITEGASNRIVAGADLVLAGDRRAAKLVGSFPGTTNPVLVTRVVPFLDAAGF